MLAADLIRGGAVGTARRADADAARSRSGTIVALERRIRCRRRRSSTRRSTRSCPEIAAGSRTGAGERARPARAADRVPAGRARDRRLARRRASAPARPSPSTLPRSSSRRSPSPRCARPRRRSGSRSSIVKRDPRGLRVRPRPRLALGHAVSAAFAYLAFMGPTEVLLPYVVKNELGGSASDARPRVRGRRPGRDPERLVCGARPATARHHVDVHLLDGRDARGRRLRPRAGELAADARMLPVQRPRDGGHDHLGDRQAAARPAGAARPRLELRLADLDRPGAGVVRAHRADRGVDRRARDARLRREWSAAPSRSAALFLPGMRAIERADAVAGGHPPVALSTPAETRRAA